MRRKRRARVGKIAAEFRAAHKAAVHKGAARSKGSREVKKGGVAWAERLRYVLSKGVPLVAPPHVASSHGPIHGPNDGKDNAKGKDDGKAAKANVLSKVI